MGQKQRKDAEVKGTLPNTAVQSDNSKAPENAIGEVMEHSQKNAEPRTGALRMEPHEREEQILKIAAEHFARRGVLGASMSAIARDAGITRALLYHYFPGKDSDAKPTQSLRPWASITKTPKRRCAMRYARTSSL